MSEIVIEIDGIFETILKNPRFLEIQKYVDILAETGEFTSALADLEREIMKSVEDAKVTKNEIRKVSVRMFKVLKMLYDKNFKFKTLNSNQSEKLRHLLRDHIEEILTVLVVKAVNAMRKHVPELDIIELNEEDIELIVGTIVDTAEWSINMSKKNLFKWFPYCAKCCNA